MSKLKALFLATSVITALVVAGCGDDDDNKASSSSSSSSGDVNPDVDGSIPDPGTDGGTDGPAPANNFPQYVKTLIETKTADNGLPDGEQVWTALPDDESAATSTALFPATFFQ